MNADQLRRAREAAWNAPETCPKCGAPVEHAPGIGPYCPRTTCDALDDLREGARDHEPAMKALAGTPDPAAWVEPAAIRAQVEAEIVAWLHGQFEEHGSFAYRAAALAIEAGAHRQS
jgi:hypothetical protein